MCLSSEKSRHDTARPNSIWSKSLLYKPSQNFLHVTFTFYRHYYFYLNGEYFHKIDPLCLILIKEIINLVMVTELV